MTCVRRPAALLAIQNAVDHRLLGSIVVGRVTHAGAQRLALGGNICFKQCRIRTQRVAETALRLDFARTRRDQVEMNAVSLSAVKERTDPHRPFLWERLSR